MIPPSRPIVSLGLIAGGALVWAGFAGPITATPGVAIRFNPLGINCSPYGEVLAMAMQGPIDVYFHEGVEGHDHGPDEPCGEDCDHDHAPPQAQTPAAATKPLPWFDRLVQFVGGIDRTVNTRTNPKPASAALKFYLRRQTEDKLRFAHNLDPAHYGNFASYYFFLTQSSLGTRPELTPSAVKLAQETIDYCLARDDDPRAALTAAAAAEDILEQLMEDQRSGDHKPTLTELRQTLSLLDLCLARHADLSARWDSSGNWNLLSEQRRSEVRDRLFFLKKVRLAQATAIQTLDQTASPSAPPTATSQQ